MLLHRCSRSIRAHRHAALGHADEGDGEHQQVARLPRQCDCRAVQTGMASQFADTAHDMYPCAFATPFTLFDLTDFIGTRNIQQTFSQIFFLCSNCFQFFLACLLLQKNFWLLATTKIAGRRVHSAAIGARCGGRAGTLFGCLSMIVTQKYRINLPSSCIF
jgi:hypothetical protein